MKIIKTRELQIMKLELLKIVDEICNKENIKYFLGYGTLLGAVREKGFIKWDEDIDLLMLRDDFEKFNIVAPEYLPPKYFMQNYKTEKYFIPPISRICINGTYRCRKEYEKINFNKGTFIDIFPLDALTEVIDKSIYQYKKVKRLMSIMKYKLQMPISKTFHKKGIKYFIKGILFFLPQRYLQNLIYRTIMMTRDSNSDFVGSLGGDYEMNIERFHKNWFDNTIYLDFEDGKFPCPICYGEFLNHVYGDYMTPPKESDRKLDEPSYYLSVD